MKNFFVIILFVISIFSIACEEAFLENNHSEDPVANFESLWNTLDKKYSYFIIKGIDWDSVYQVYRPQIAPEMTDQELFDVFSNMLFSLEDGHVNLFTDFNLARNWQWYLNSPPNFDFELVERSYLKEDYEISGPLHNTFISNTEIGYIYYGSFQSTILSDNIDYVIDKFSNAQGIIIDIRNNGGGSLSNSNRLASRFFDQQRLVKVELYKTGPAHDEFSQPIAQSLKPDGDSQFTGPIVLLTNRSSYSAANDFTLKMSILPYVTIIGDTTGGGGGIPISQELPNGWRYRFSSTATFTPDGVSIEAGIPPDIPINLDTADILRGRDTMIERAIEVLQN